MIPDDFETIQSVVRQSKENHTDLLIFTGGTGLSPRDVTPEAVGPFIDREIPGVMETARNYGQQRIKTAMLSRGIAGFSEKTLILTLPGSKKAVEENMEALFPQLLHVFELNDQYKH